jgi:hypothetical protein
MPWALDAVATTVTGSQQQRVARVPVILWMDTAALYA